MMDEALLDVARAYRKRRQLAERLSEQDRYIGHLIRHAREQRHTWEQIGDACGISDVMARKASLRPEEEPDRGR